MENTIKVKLNSIENAQKFVDICNQFENIDIDYIVGRYSVDAKSIMGIFSLDLSKTVTLEIEEWKDEYMEMLKQYIAV